MPAYIIVNVTIHNIAEYEEYKKLTPATVATYGGKFLVRGGAIEILEGNPPVGRIVVLEFPTATIAKEWWSSEEYGEAKIIRQRSSTTEMILVEGASV